LAASVTALRETSPAFASDETPANPSDAIASAIPSTLFMLLPPIFQNYKLFCRTLRSFSAGESGLFSKDTIQRLTVATIVLLTIRAKRFAKYFELTN
jgi:hypothetical protein